MSDVQTEFLFEMWVTMREGYDVGATPSGRRRIGNIGGGTIEGPKIKGEILNSGADWAIMRPDGATAVDVRLAFRTDDGAVVYMTYNGVISGPPEILARRARGEDVDRSQLFIRTAPTFHTSSEKYEWLNRVVAVGIGDLAAGRPHYKVYAIL